MGIVFLGIDVAESENDAIFSILLSWSDMSSSEGEGGSDINVN